MPKNKFKVGMARALIWSPKIVIGKARVSMLVTKLAGAKDKALYQVKT